MSHSKVHSIRYKHKRRKVTFYHIQDIDYPNISTHILNLTNNIFVDRLLSTILICLLSISNIWILAITIGIFYMVLMLLKKILPY